MLGAQENMPAPLEPVPSRIQYEWQTMEMYAFVHLSLNTWTNQSWGYGNEDVSLFDPAQLDCRQWARVCKEAGMKGIIITAKHHGGFCLWPSRYTEYSVKNAPWKKGKGDVVREMADACREYGLKLGIYLSPWDRNHPSYGKPEYIDYFRKQLTELLTNYGPIFEVWFDGANGGSGYYGGANETRKIDRTTYYEWPETYRLIRILQPDCVIWNDGGDRGDLRWVGTEEGYVGETNWSQLNGTGDVDWGMLHYGLEGGDSWVPAEVNTSIRPEWFYHPEEDGKVKPVTTLLDIYYNSVGRNACMLLNFPIKPDGLIHPADEKAALGLASALKDSFADNHALGATVQASNTRQDAELFGASRVLDGKPDTFWATDDDVNSASLTIDLASPTLVNRFMVQEYIALGQRIKSFMLEAEVDGSWKEIARGSTVGYKRILRFPVVKTSRLRFTVLDAKDCIVLSQIGIYSSPVLLSPPLITRNQSGTIALNSRDPGAVFYYTLDGTEPGPGARAYSKPIPSTGKLTVRAIAWDPVSRKSSAEGVEAFDIDRSKWKILGTTDRKSWAVVDGNDSTTWHQSNTGKNGRKQLPVDLVIDMGEEHTLKGFRYCPDQARWSSGIITKYQFLVSTNNAGGEPTDWKLVDEGEFSNIQNNPVWQTKTFAPCKARYFKLRALRNTQGDGTMGYAGVDVLTE